MAAAACGSSTSTMSAPAPRRSATQDSKTAFTSGASPSSSMSAGTTPTFIDFTPASSVEVKSMSMSWLVQSRLSRPAMAFMTRAASSTLRANGPTWSSDEPKATTPWRLTKP